MIALSHKLLDVLPDSGIVLVLGKVRSGKSALAYSLLEHQAAKRRAFVYGLPIEKAPLLPNSIGLLTSLDFPEGAAVLCDEAYRTFYARQSMSAANKFIDQLSGLVGQRDLLVVYITQSARKLELGLVEASQVLLIKRPSLLQMRLDRSELRGIIKEADAAFRTLKVRPGVQRKAYEKRCTYVLSDDFEGMVEESNGVPSFWTEELSKAFAGVSLTDEPGPAAREAHRDLPTIYPSDVRDAISDVRRRLYRLVYELFELDPALVDAAERCAKLLEETAGIKGRWPEFIAAMRELEMKAGPQARFVSPIARAAEGLTPLLEVL